MPPGRRTPWSLLALASAALLSSWNPASAPLGLAVGAVAAGLCLVARRQAGAFTPVLRAATILAVVAVIASAAVVARLAGAGREREGQPIVEGVPSAERREALDRAAASTKKGRDAAREELRALEPSR